MNKKEGEAELLTTTYHTKGFKKLKEKEGNNKHVPSISLLFF